MATLTVNAPELSDLHFTLDEIAEQVQDGMNSGVVGEVTWAITD